MPFIFNYINKLAADLNEDLQRLRSEICTHTHGKLDVVVTCDNERYIDKVPHVKSAVIYIFLYSFLVLPVCL